jgi:hypothetical protein
MNKTVVLVILLMVVSFGVAFLLSPRETNAPTDEPIEESQNEVGTFNEVGNIVKDNPGMEPGLWYVVYEQAGSPAVSKVLEFLPTSICVQNAGNNPCEPELFNQGNRVRVEGSLTNEDTVEVVRMEFVD